MVMKLEYIITFENTSLAMKAEKALLAESLDIGVLPLPSQISAGCGICLRVKQDDINEACDVLKDKNIIQAKIFFRISKNGQYVYVDCED